MATMSKSNMRVSASLMMILIFCLVSSCIAQFCEGQVPGKLRWPELVGVDGRVAAKIIEKENPLVHANVQLEGTLGTKDINCRRVRVFVSKINGKVVQVPYVG